MVLLVIYHTTNFNVLNMYAGYKGNLRGIFLCLLDIFIFSQDFNRSTLLFLILSIPESKCCAAEKSCEMLYFDLLPPKI